VTDSVEFLTGGVVAVWFVVVRGVVVTGRVEFVITDVVVVRVTVVFEEVTDSV